jgi:hypothetical protein
MALPVRMVQDSASRAARGGMRQARSGIRQARSGIRQARGGIGQARGGIGQARGAADSAWRAAERIPRKQLVLYAGLGAAAAVSVIEWPVALAVAAGSEIARRTARAGRQQA